MGAQENWDILPGVVDEHRDDRVYSEVVLPFVAQCDGFVMQGTKFSIGGFEILCEGTDVTSGGKKRLDHKAFATRDRPFELRINLSGFVLELNIRAAFVGTEGEGRQERLLFAITEISAHEEQALRRVIRAYLAGQIANADDVIRAMDGPTSSIRKNVVSVNARTSPWRTRLLAGLTTLICLTAAMVASISLYDRVSITRAEFATVTAPKIDLVSQVQGRLETNVAAGDMVRRDSLVFQLEDAALEAEIALSEARLKYLRSLGNRTLVKQDKFDRALLETQNAALRFGGDEEVLKDEISLEEGRLKSLELRLASLTRFAPCDCLVRWIEEDGAGVTAGMPIARLAKVGTHDLQVEALIKLTDMAHLEPGQSAFIRWNGSSEMIPAIIGRIFLDHTTRPRTGFPKWLRQDKSMGSVTLVSKEEIDPRRIGMPAEVFVTDRLPLMTRFKELIWR